MTKVKSLLTKEQYAALGDATVKASDMYELSGNQYILAPEVVNGVRVTDDSAVRQALEVERATVADLKKKVGGMGDKDDAWVAKAVAAIARVEKLGDDPDVKAQVRAAEAMLKEQLEAKGRADLEARDKRLGVREKQIRRLLGESEARRIMSEADTKAESPDLLLPHVLAQTDVVENGNGELDIVVLGADGKTPRITTEQGKTGNMGLKELVKTMKDNPKFAVAFSGSGAVGSGAAGGAAGGGGSSTGNHVISFEDSKNPQKYWAADAAAEKAGRQLQIAAPAQST